MRRTFRRTCPAPTISTSTSSTSTSSPCWPTRSDARKSFTRYGDGPLDTDETYGLVYGPPPRIQPECQAALAGLAEDIEKRGKRLVVMTMPLLGQWSDRYDRASQARKGLASGVRRALEGTSAAFWDGWSEIVIPPPDYTDAVHLRWSAVPRFTRRLIRATGFGEPDL